MKFSIALGFRMTLLILISATASTSYAQKEAEIVRKFRTALRGCVSEDAEPTMAAKGSLKMNEVTFAARLHYHKPSTRTELTIQGVTIIYLDNYKTHWEYNPFTNRHFIKELDPEESKKLTKKAKAIDFASKELLNYKALKNELKFKGEQMVDTIATYVLELKSKDTDLPQLTFYLDKRTSLIYKCEYGTESRWYTNYKPIGNYVYPTVIANKDVNGVVGAFTFDELIIGKPIPDSLFVVPDEAFARYKELEGKIEILLEEADTLSVKSQYDAAIWKYTDVMKLDGGNFKAFNGRGLAMTNQGKFYEAINDFSIAININPRGGVAFNNRGLAKYYIGDANGAMEDYTEALRLDTSLVSAYKNRGFLYLHAEKYAEAREDFSKAVTLYPTDGDAHLKYGFSTAQLGNYAEALASYNKAIELHTVTDDVFNYRGIAEFKLEKYQEAVISFREAVKKNGDNLQYRENLGNALYYAGDFKSAQRELELYLQKESKNAEIYNMIAHCKYNDEDYKGSIKDFTKAIELNDNSAVYYSNRALAKEQLEDYEGAISDYTESISRNPTEASTFYNRGLIKILSSKKLEGCIDLVTAKDMKYEAATEAIMKNCN